jgi:recombinational DNA repair protein (RecF pathway)
LQTVKIIEEQIGEREFPFTPLLVRWSGRGEVKTLRNAEAVSLALPLSGITGRSKA